MNVFKFGGSCLTGPESLTRVRDLVREFGTPVVCVLSALKGTTDRLLALVSGSLYAEYAAGEASYIRRVRPAVVGEYHALEREGGGGRLRLGGEEGDSEQENK